MLVNIIVFVIMWYLPNDIGAFFFLFLVFRFLKWLFVDAQDIEDDYMYSRYRRARDRYEARRK